MREARLTATRRIDLFDVPRPEPQPGQVLVAVSQCGVSTSDFHTWRGDAPEPFPHRMGHEIAGVVEAVGRGVTTLSAGDHVAVWSPHGRGFADAVVAEELHCVKVDPWLPDPAVLVPLARAVYAIEYAGHVHAWRNEGQWLHEQHVVIVGATGFTGDLLLRALLADAPRPRSITVTGRRARPLERALELGATRVVNTEEERITDVVYEMTDGVGADTAFDASGVEAGLLLAHAVTREAGTVAWYGDQQGEDRRLPVGWYSKRDQGIANAPVTPRDPASRRRIMAAMRAARFLLESRRVEPAGLISHGFPLADIGSAFQAADLKPNGFTKSVVCMD
jgi:threonine dehydrogenase-like Zn-dependent dehydrogenase